MDNSPQHWLFVLEFHVSVFQKQYFVTSVDLFYLKMFLFFSNQSLWSDPAQITEVISL